MKTSNRYRMSRSSTFLLMMPLCLIILTCGSAAGSTVEESLAMCARVLIPSLFPYMVISAMLVQGVSAERTGKYFDGIMRKLFDLPGCAFSAFFLGALCGFPIGAKSACELHSRGLMNKGETERLIALANNAGPAFVIEVVGVCFWNSRGMGIILYLAQIVSAVIIGIFLAHLPSKNDHKPMQDSVPVVQNENITFLSSLSRAVSSSAQSMLTVCGFVVFFASLSGLIEHLLCHLNLRQLLPFTHALLEFSGGSAQAASLGGTSGAFLAGLAVGWSGLSVFAQCSIFTSEAGISLRTACAAKCIQGILCGTAAAFWYDSAAVSALSSPAVQTGEFPDYALVIEIVLLILFCLVPLPRKYSDFERTHEEIRENN